MGITCRIKRFSKNNWIFAKKGPLKKTKCIALCYGQRTTNSINFFKEELNYHEFIQTPALFMSTVNRKKLRA